MIAIKEYAERRGVSTQAIYKQLKVHKEALDGHIIKENGKTMLDDFAVEYLNGNVKENPLILVDAELQEELDRLRRRETELLDELNNKNNQLLMMKDQMIQLQLENQQLKLAAPEVVQPKKKWWEFWK